MVVDTAPATALAIELALPPVAVLDDPLELARYTRWTVGPAGQRLGVSAPLAPRGGVVRPGLKQLPAAGLAQGVLQGR